MKDKLIEAIDKIAEESKEDFLVLMKRYEDAVGEKLDPLKANAFLAEVYATMASLNKDLELKAGYIGAAIFHIKKAIEQLNDRG